MTRGLEKIKGWFGRTGASAEEVADGGEPVATPPSGTVADADRETSTNAQMEGSVDEPWSGNR